MFSQLIIQDVIIQIFRAKDLDGLSSVPDPNGPLQLSARVTSDDSVCQPTERYLGARGIFAELAASAAEGKKSGPCIYHR